MVNYNNTKTLVTGEKKQLVSIYNPAQIIIQPIGGDIFLGDVNTDLRENGLLLVAGQTLGFGDADFPRNANVQLYAVATNPLSNFHVRVMTMQRGE